MSDLSTNDRCSNTVSELLENDFNISTTGDTSLRSKRQLEEGTARGLPTNPPDLWSPRAKKNNIKASGESFELVKVFGGGGPAPAQTVYCICVL